MSSTSNGNIVFDNYLNNVFNSDVKDGSEGNLWNTTKTAGTNIVGGPYIGGNFWAKPDGTGFSQTATDGNGDGIADTAYKLQGNNYSDFLPLVDGFEPEQSVTPPINSNIISNGTTSTATGTNETKITANETAVNKTETNKTEINKTEVNKTETTVNKTKTYTSKTEMDDDSETKIDIDETEDDVEFD